MADHGNQRDVRLRQHRVQRALTQQDVAERLVQLAWVRFNRHVGVNADMVSKWERGEKRPSRFYLKVLGALFQASPTQLGLAPATSAAAPLGSSVPAEQEQAAEVMQVCDVLDGMQARVELLQPKLLSLWRDDLLRRRQVLKLIGAAPAGVGLDAIDSALGFLPEVRGARFRGSETVTALDELVRHLEGVYHVSDPQRLLLPVRALIGTVEDFLAEVRDHRVRTALLETLARGSLLAGRLSFFDLHESMHARAHLALAREASQEAANRVLTSVVLGHEAFLPAAKGNYSAASSYLSAARDGLSRRPVPLVSSWVSAVEGELHTQAGSINRALRSLERAEEELPTGRQGNVPAPAWFDFYDAKRLSGFEGSTLRQAGAYGDARVKLETALAQGATVTPKQRAVSMVDLATACVEQGDIDEGCRLATEAAADLHRAGYATAVDRLRQFRGTLPDGKHPAATLLTESISELS